MPKFRMVFDGYDAGVVVPDLFDVLDYDGSPNPTIILRMQYYESSDYVLLALRNGQWTNIYRGGGGGC